MSGIVGSAAVLIGAQPTSAAAQVTAVRLNPTAAGVNILLQTKGSDRPQVFSVNRGKSWTADIVNTQLQIPGGTFRQTNPTPGIALIEVVPLDRNSVRVTVTGQSAAPVGQVSRDNGSLLFSLSRSSGKQAKNAAPVAAKPSAKAAPLRSQKPASQAPTLPPVPSVAAKPAPAPAARNSLPVVQPSATPTTRTPSAVPANPSAIAQNVPSPMPPFKGGTPLVQNPEVRIEGGTQVPVPTPPVVPNPLPRAVAPPVGDIAVGQIDASPSFIDLATAERVPRLVLRDASSREVLSLLARSAGLNIVFTADQSGPPGQQQQQQQPGQAPLSDGPRVTLDIENEPVQNVFNYVLQIAGLEANRRGNTVFVGPRLPNSARNLVSRSLRLNQIPITGALNFLVALGAEAAVSRERQVVSLTAIPVTQLQGAAQQTAGTQALTTTETRVEVQRVNFLDSIPLLRGLQVAGDERTNTITITGESRKVDIAIAQLTQLDVRRRQVAVNVRVIDVDLRALDALGTSFSFGVGDTQVVSEGGIGLVNIGRRAPSSSGISANFTNNTVGASIQTPNSGNLISNFARGFFLQLQAAVTNGNAKILTDPTLVIQEGQTAQVRLTEEVVTNVRQQVTATENSSQITVEVEKAAAGLILPVRVERIDDNGFIALSVAPSIARPASQFQVNFGDSSNIITLLNERRVESGQFRLRDGQTLVLAGIIQDEDRSEVTKIPILGDIPILGALFRRTQRSNQRREVIVLVTPRVLDDTDRSAFGYSYTPGSEINKVLERNQR
ncbi:MAG: AMIN domain-containing protein [Leptolyngbyaceae cyanobacterium RU_5_1]|nr:AMIN domain-containing protein [Leptolyngbyaceae cyanobacterium RU_5_1]